MTGCNDDMYMCNTIFDCLKSAIFETNFTSIASILLPRMKLTTYALKKYRKMKLLIVENIFKKRDNV